MGTFKALKDFHSNLTAFVSTSNCIAEARLLVRLDSQLRNIKDNMDALAEDLANMTFFLKKNKAESTAWPSSALKRSNRVRKCSYCNKLRYNAMNCENNPH